MTMSGQDLHKIIKRMVCVADKEHTQKIKIPDDLCHYCKSLAVPQVILVLCETSVSFHLQTAEGVEHTLNYGARNVYTYVIDAAHPRILMPLCFHEYIYISVFFIQYKSNKMLVLCH